MSDHGSCHKCSTPIPGPNAKFCLKCGTKFTSGGSAPSTPTKAPAPTSAPSTPTHSSTTTQTSQPSTPVHASTSTPPATPTKSASSPAHSNSPVSASPRKDGGFCHTCKGIIVGQVAEDSKGLKFHPNCFACHACSAPITAAYTYDEKDRVTCDTCARKQLRLTGEDICSRCKEKIQGEAVFVVGSNRFHKACFNCVKCAVHLEGAAIITTDKGLMCKPCHLKDKGLVCSACHNLIEHGAVQAIEKLWHNSCFVCAGCKKNLVKAGQYYAEGGIPYCPDCVPAVTVPTPTTQTAPPATTQAAPAAASSRPKFCGNCGHPVSGGKFCSECGTPL